MMKRRTILVLIVIIISLSGIYYVKLTPIAPEPLPAPALIAIEVSKDAYLTGEPVEFTIKNIGHSTVYLPTTAPWHVEKMVNDAWTLVLSPTALHRISLKPGESLSYSWGQTDYNREQVSPGVYRIGVSWYGGPIVHSQEFDIYGLTIIMRKQ
ncbi:MAG: hypothetical protein BME93_01695 [Methanosarcinales archaeon Met12]|nr:MAG: hypothetical protein BME93_01695 [Methanosarcinales archaeon Met12]